MSMNGMSFEKTALRECYPAESARLGGTWYYRMTATGQILEVDVMVVRSEDWPDRKEFRDPSWSAMEFGDLTVVVKALF
jgi:hypothetical protein